MPTKIYYLLLWKPITCSIKPKKVKEIVENPDAFQSTQPTATTTTTTTNEKKPSQKDEPVEEPEEKKEEKEESDDMGIGFFGDDQ